MYSAHTCFSPYCIWRVFAKGRVSTKENLENIGKNLGGLGRRLRLLLCGVPRVLLDLKVIEDEGRRAAQFLIH